ncbi:peroxiredoxin [Caldithrix abyssi]|nr:peroxiredoxin [Caldithrix abyssi]
MTKDTELPINLPIPVDDGACDHLTALELPDVCLASTDDQKINLSQLKGLTVIYIYPMSSPTNDSLPDNWDEIPGARGCTPQACSFRDHHNELTKFNASLFGMSTQSIEYLKSEVLRIHLPYPLLSDEDLKLKHALSLPVFDVKVAGTTVNKRVTLICYNNVIKKVFYPVFPPDKSADQTIDWLSQNKS